jgi:hypothetical protein
MEAGASLMFVPGFLIAILTFPGVIVHEAAHMFFCKLRGVAVLDVCFFRFGNPAGYVVHESTEDFLSNFLISVGPFIVNSILCIVICFPVSIPVDVFGQSGFLSYALLYLGVSIGMNAFPSTADGRNLWNHAKVAVQSGNKLAIAGFPLVAAIYAANILSVIWLDALYGLGLGLWAPKYVLGWIA